MYDYSVIRNAIVAEMVAAGWTTDVPLGTYAIAKKHFETIVGPLQAVAYFYPWKRENVATLSCQYFSVGRDILEPIKFSAKPGMSTVEAGAGTATFVTAVEAVIDASYARRIFLLDS